MPTVARMTSLWLDRAPRIDTDPFEQNARYDVIVVGAGLTGLTTALLLARAGRRVAVIEARRVGAVTTGNTTAKLSLLQGSQLQKIAARNTRRVLEAYLEANREGQAWLLRYAADHGVPVQRRDALSYAGTPDGRPTVEREHAVARGLGLPVHLTDATELPFATHGAVVLPEQAQFDPLDMLAALAADLREHGGVVVDGVRVTGVRTADEPVEVTTSRASLWADRVVMATGTPVLDRGLYWAKLVPQRSYAAAFRVPAGPPLPQAMHLSVDAPTRSVRTAPDRGVTGSDAGELLLVGGNGHTVGRHRSPAACVDDLTAWTEQHWPGAERTHVWSAQDYESPHRVPFVGWMPRTRRRVMLATGYDKWGMTNAAQAALALSAELLGHRLLWAETLHRRPTLPRALAEGIGANAAVGWWYARSWARMLATTIPDRPPVEGSGVAGHDGAALAAVSTVEGRTCRVSPLCTHLGAAVTWNDLERSWDCPAHGSRFAPDGALLEGPATRELPRR